MVNRAVGGVRWRSELARCSQHGGGQRRGSRLYKRKIPLEEENSHVLLLELFLCLLALNGLQL